MYKLPDERWKYELLRKEFPNLSDEDLNGMKEFLDDYAELLLRVCDRMEKDGSLDKLIEENKETP